MMEKFRTKLVVFDIAGTIIRSSTEVTECFYNAFKKFNKNIPKEEINKVRGYKKSEAIKILLNKYCLSEEAQNENLIASINDAFEAAIGDYYKVCKIQSLELYAEDTFVWLKKNGIRIGLDTGFTRSVTDVILRRMNWGNSSLIDKVISSDEVAEGRPSPLMIQAIMSSLDIKDSSAVMKVGDTEIDILEGRNANCGAVVAVTTGVHTRQQLELCKPDFVIDTLSEIPSIIK